MSIICTLFGHKPHPNGYSMGAYMRVVPGGIDGIGTEHARVMTECHRCATVYQAGMIHLPARKREAYLKTALERMRIDLNEAREQLAAITLGGM